LRRCASARAEGAGGHPGRGHRQQRRGDGEPRSPAYGRVVSCQLHQVGDLPRCDREEPDAPERSFQRSGDREQEVMPFVQMCALVRQDRIKLAIV